jgi:hypothetical protein
VEMCLWLNNADMHIMHACNTGKEP